MMRIPAELRPEDVAAVIDTREQLPFDLPPLHSITGTLAAGDYSYVGGEHVAAIERKSLSDLIGCVTGERQRFERELQRMLAYPIRAVVCEFAWGDIDMAQWRSKVTAASVEGSILGWIATGIPFVLCGTRHRAERYTAKILYIAARRRWREARALASSAMERERATA